MSTHLSSRGARSQARRRAVQSRLREVTLAFSRAIADERETRRPLEVLAQEVTAILDARRTTVWLHDRRSRELVLAATSDGQPPAGTRERIGHRSPAARGLRLDSPVSSGDPPDRLLLVPLRGRRRALGTLVAEGLARDEQILDLAADLGRQVSVDLENVQLLDEVLRQRRLLENTFNSLVDLVIVTDQAQRVIQMNGACVARLGRSREDLFERSLCDVLGAEVAEWALGIAPPAQGFSTPATPDERCMRTRTFQHAELGGTFSITVTPLIGQDGDPAGRVLVARDITEQNRLETERETLRTRLAQSEKLASLGQFVAGIGHEMNNPLQGVLGHLELLIGHSEAARPLRRELRTIYHEADRAARIVQNLLVFTGSRRMARRRLRVERLLTRVLSSRRARLARSGIQVIRRQAEATPQVIGDPLLLQQAFLNVLINAEHAIGENGPPGRIELTTGTNARGQVVTTIRDSGPGISADVLSRIFDPFFTTKDVGTGTGLGLAITYGIIQEHGGAIHAGNSPEGGALFTIELPAVQKA